LADAGLEWLVEQVDELIAEGVYEVSAKRKGQAELREEVERPADARRGSSSVRPYTTAERLALLLGSARRVAKDGEALEEAVDDLLLSGDDQVADHAARGRLEFFDERRQQTARELTHGENRAPRRAVAERLLAALDELAERAGVVPKEAA
jgi:hypothetical protein